MVYARRMRRREFLAGAMLAIPAVRLARAQTCGPTEGVELGPFFRPHAPERASLCDPSETGEPLAVVGRVLAADTCAPLAGATVDVWHADRRGAYDIDAPGPSDRPFRLRAMLRSDAGGRYGFDTIEPGPYGQRARHIHYFVHADGYEPLVTQMYFARDPRLSTDRLVRRSLVTTPAPAEVRGHPGGKVSFDLVLRRRMPNPPAAVATFAALEGEYGSPSGPFRLVGRDDRLFARADGIPELELLFDDVDRFRVLELGLRGRVVRNHGAVSIDTVDASGARERAEKR